MCTPISLLSKTDQEKLFPGIKINTCDTKLQDYNKNEIKVYGFISVKVQFLNQTNDLNLHIVDSTRQLLLGREWIKSFEGIDWNKILKGNCSVNNIIKTTVSPKREELLRNFSQKISNNIRKNIGKNFQITRKIMFLSFYKGLSTKLYPINNLLKNET